MHHPALRTGEGAQPAFGIRRMAFIVEKPYHLSIWGVPDFLWELLK